MSRILLTENSVAPSTPATGKLAVYAKADKKLYIKDDTGAETDLTVGGEAAAWAGETLGDGVDVYAGEDAGTQQFRALTAGANISLTVDANGAIEIAATGGDGTGVTNGANLGTGAGVFSDTDGAEMRFRSLESDSAELTITQEADRIALALDLSGLPGGSSTLQEAYDAGATVAVASATPIEFALADGAVGGSALRLGIGPDVLSPSQYIAALRADGRTNLSTDPGVGNGYAAQFMGNLLLGEWESHTSGSAETEIIRTSRGMTGTDVNGGDLHLELGGGNGAGAPGALLVSNTVPTTSGTTEQARTTTATFTGDALGTHLRLDDRLLLELRSSVPSSADVDPEGTAGTLLSGSDGELYYVSPTGDATQLTDTGSLPVPAASLQSAYETDEHITVTTAPVTVETMNPVTAMSLSVATVVTPTEAAALLYVNGFTNVSHAPGTPNYYAAHLYGDVLLGAEELHESGTPATATFRLSSGATGTDLGGGDLQLEVGAGTGAGTPGALFISNSLPGATGTTSQSRKMTATFTGDAVGTHLRLDDRLLLEMRGTIPSAADVDPEGTAGTFFSGSDGEFYYVSPIGDTTQLTRAGTIPMSYDPDAIPAVGADNAVPYTNEDGTSGSTNSAYVENQLIVTARESLRAGLQIRTYGTYSEVSRDPWLELADYEGDILAAIEYASSQNQVSVGTKFSPLNQPASILLYAANSSNNSSGSSAGLQAGGGGPGTAGGTGNDGGNVMLRPGPKGDTPANGSPGKDGAVQLLSADGTKDTLLSVDNTTGDLKITVGPAGGRTNLTASKLGRQAFRSRMSSVGQGSFLFPDWAPTQGQVVAIRVYQLAQNNNAQVTSFQLRVRKFTGVQAINQTFDQGVNLLTQDFVDLNTMPAGTVQTFALTASGPDKQFAEADRWAFQVKAEGAAPNASNLMFELIFQAN